MGNIIDVKVYYHNNVYLSVKGKCFREVFELVWLSETFRNHTPIKAVFPVNNQILSMDKNVWMAYLSKEISKDDLFEATRCDGFYRNAFDVFADYGYHVDKGSLWKLRDNKLILIHDDEFVECEMDKKVFVEFY
jgi:hypothetical protein